jgi:hypothetical protein
LVAILSIDEMGELDSIKLTMTSDRLGKHVKHKATDLFGNDAIKIDKGGRHHVKESIGQTLSLFKVPVAF